MSARGLFAVLACLLLATPLAAQDSATLLRIKTAWQDWTAQVGATKSAISIGYQGAAVDGFGKGRSPQDPAPIASLSKAITAVCVVAATGDTKIAIDQSIGSQLPLPRTGKDGAAIKVRELMLHISGLTNDRTQRQMAGWIDQPTPRHAEVAAKTLRTGPKPGRAGQFVYNNENYAVLGALLDKVAGGNFLPFCNDLILAPLGVQAQLSPRFGAYGAWGGLEMSAEDYLRFVMPVFGETRIAQDPLAFPHTTLGGGMHYGTGSFFRPFQGNFNFWHFGALCFGDTAQAGAFFAVWQGDWAVSVNYDICPTNDQMRDLDAALVAAVFIR